VLESTAASELGNDDDRMKNCLAACQADIGVQPTYLPRQPRRVGQSDLLLLVLGICLSRMIFILIFIFTVMFYVMG
jgi:hypothetical protein